jgi:hypothetical protein
MSIICVYSCQLVSCRERNSLTNIKYHVPLGHCQKTHDTWHCVKPVLRTQLTRTHMYVNLNHKIKSYDFELCPQLRFRPPLPKRTPTPPASQSPGKGYESPSTLPVFLSTKAEILNLSQLEPWCGLKFRIGFSDSLGAYGDTHGL